MAIARERFFVKLLLFISCSSSAVVICQSQGFTCFSSTDCRGNKIDGKISVIAECCAIDAGLSFEENTGECGNCFTDEKFESRGEKFYLSIFSNYEPSEYFRTGRIRLAVEPVGREMATFMVDALGAQTVYIAPTEVSMDSGLLDLESVSTRDKAIFVKSEAGDPLSVVAYVEEFQSSDTFKVFPCVAQPVVAYEYYAVSVPQSFIVLPPDPDYPDYEDVLDPQGNSAIVIVTTEENTVLNVTLTQDVSISGASDIVGQIGTDLLRSGEQVSFQLSARGSTLYLASLDDLTGSRVVSNKPIAFITGHECGTLPHDIQYCDHLVEQITPTSTWGREFIISTIATREEFDTFTIIASRNDTSVSVACTITDVPPLNLNTDGSFVEFHINSTDSCYLESNQPILLAQFSVSSLVDRVFNSDPFLVIIPPVEQYRSSYVFNTFTGTRSLFRSGQNYINILLPAGVGHEGLRLDEQPLSDDASIISILCPNSDTVCATTVQLTVSDDRHNLNHIDDGAQFSAIVYWLSYRVAHGYSAGMTQNPIALPSVSLQRSNFVVFENESVVAILLTRTGDTGVPATVFVSTAEISDGGNALSGEDFVVVSRTAVEFGPNEDLVTVMIDIVDDVFPENTEKFEVFLSTSPGVYIVSPAYANVTILNDDPPLPVMNVSFVETTIEVMEGVGLVTFTLEKTMGALGPVAVQIFTTSRSAVDGDDFVAIDDVITFEIENLQATISTLVLDNLSLEGVEEFTVHIEPVVGDFPVAVQNSIATVSIRDNDVVVLGFEQPTYTVSEENDQLIVSVSISHGSLERSVVATVETISGSAVDNDDFVPVTRVLSFDSVTTEQSITISIINDNQVEVNEVFNIRVVIEEEDSSNIIVSPDEAVITIVDTDRVEINLLPIATTVREGEGSARVNVSVVEGRLGGPVSIALTTFNINTTGGVDYTEVSTEISLSPSDSFQEVLIPISDDTVYDGPEDEKFLITATLKSGQNTDRIDVQISSQTVTIVDNEPRPIAFVQFSETSYTTVEDAREIVLLVESDGINYDLFTVDYFYLSGEAQDGLDIIFPVGSLQFPPGSTTAAITVPIIDDGIAELAETFTVQLMSTGAILMSNSTTVTIIDNDVVTVGFGQMVYSVTERQNAEVILTITKTTLTDRTVSVMFSTLDGTALAGVDYEQLNQVLTFQPNENTREVTVRILNNEIQEPGSRLFFGQLRSLSSSDVNISLPTASVLIEDDDQSNIPSQPLNFETSPQTTAVEFTWNQPSVDTIDNYVLMWTYLSPCERGSPRSVLLDGTARQYILEGLEENSSYSFSLQARNSAGNGPDAMQVVITRAAAPSGSPQSLRIVSTTPTGITVEWSDINCLKQNGAITTYDVRVNGIVVLTTSQTQATITGLTSSTAYFIDVRGNNSIGGGPFSPTSMFVTAGAENVTIGFDRDVYFVTEGEAAVLRVVLSEPVSLPITVGVSTIDHTTEEAEDYLFEDAIVTFSAGETQQIISIIAVDDNIGEANETFNVVFSGLPPNVNIGTFPFSTVVIIDDDETFALECIQTSVSPSGPIRIACIPMNGEVASVQCNYNNGLTDEPCGLGITLNLNQFEPGPLTLTITVTSTEGEIATQVFTYTVPEPLSLDCSLSAVSGRVTVSCATSRDLFLPPFCNLTRFGVIEPCDLDNIELNVVDFLPGPYNLTIIVVDVLEQTATETIGLFLSEPSLNAACTLNGSVVMCMSSLDGTLLPVTYECSFDGGDRRSCDPPFSTTDENLETGPHILTIFASTTGGQTQEIELPFIVPDINECAMGTDDCVNGATCMNTVGSFTCTCPSGFSGDGRKSGSGCATNQTECSINGEVRLVGGVHPGVLEGRLEVCLNGMWGTVCNDGWDTNDARVVCRQLGITEEELEDVVTGLSFGGGPDNQPIHFEAPTCDGSESRLVDCTFDTDDDCAKPEDVGIICQRSEDCTDGAVRLVGGDVPTEGRVEFCRGGQWGTVCTNDNAWDSDDVGVVCRQLGHFTLEPRVLTRVPEVVNLNTPIMVYDVWCTGAEPNLSECQKRTSVEYCSHINDAGANCTRDIAPVIEWEVPDITVPEGGSDPELCYTISTALNVPVTFTILSGDKAGASSPATADSDYSPISREITIGPTTEVGRACVTIPIIDDELANEDDEQFSVGFDLSGSPFVTGRNAEACVTITDNDVLVVEWERPTIVTDEGDGSTEACFTPDRNSAKPVIVSIGFAPKSANPATRDEDYGIDPEIPQFDINENTVAGEPVCMPIAIIDDIIALEGEEQLRLFFAGLPNDEAQVGPISEVCVSILDDDVLGVEFNSTDVVVNEDNGTVTICLKTNTTAAREIAIEIVTSEETGVPNAATDSEDFQPLAANVTFQPGETMSCEEVSIVDDPDEEPPEVFMVSFGFMDPNIPVRPGVIAVSVVTIIDNDRGRNETVCRVDTMRVKPFSRDNMYHFQGSCGYVLLSSCDVTGPDDFVGATANFQLDSGKPLSAGFFIRGTLWISLEDGQGFSNADVVQLPDDENGAAVFSFPDFDVISRQSPGVNSVEVGGDYQVVVTHQYVNDSFFEIRVGSGSIFTETCGLCGNQTGELLQYDRTIANIGDMAQVETFVQSYLIPPDMQIPRREECVQPTGTPPPPPPCNDGNVRLRDGTNEREGRVEVCFNGEWGTVCDDSWGDDDAAVVCRQLGFSDHGALARGDGFFGLGEDPILLDEVQCVGNEARLIDCPRTNDMIIGQHDCEHFEDAGVECQAN